MNGGASLEELVSRYLSGEMDQEGLNALEALLEADPGAREYLRRMASLDGGLRDWAEARLARAAWTEAEVGAARSPSTGERVVGRGGAGAKWPLAAAIGVGGVLMGFLSSSFVFARTLVQKEPVPIVLPVANGDFSSDEPLLGQSGPPNGFGRWGGDFSRMTGPDQGIQPAKGRRMLQFVGADNLGSPEGNRNRASEIWQLVDLRPLRGKLGNKPARIEVSARFNSVPFEEGQRINFGVGAYAFDGSSEDARSLWDQRKETAVAEVIKVQQSDRDSSTWQRLSAELIVPPEASELLLYFQTAIQARFPEPAGPVVFPGQYLSDVCLRLLSE